MEFDKIKDLMQTLDNSNLMDFELELGDGFYLRMNKHKVKYSDKKYSDKNRFDEKYSEKTSKNKQNEVRENYNLEKSSNLEQKSEEISVKNEPKKEISGGNIITSPIVGTFYASSSPTSPTFVKVGDKINEGDTVCIIEAMKVMNEIRSSFSGEVAEIFVQNEEMVEYNQPLFRII